LTLAILFFLMYDVLQASQGLLPSHLIFFVRHRSHDEQRWSEFSLPSGRVDDSSWLICLLLLCPPMSFESIVNNKQSSFSWSCEPLREIQHIYEWIRNMAGNGNLIATFEVRVLVRQNQRHWAILTRSRCPSHDKRNHCLTRNKYVGKYLCTYSVASLWLHARSIQSLKTCLKTPCWRGVCYTKPH